MSRAQRRSNAARFVTPLLKNAAAPAPALVVLQAALERGNVSNPADYLGRIVRFLEDRTWLVTNLDVEPPSVTEVADYATVTQPLSRAA